MSILNQWLKLMLTNLTKTNRITNLGLVSDVVVVPRVVYDILKHPEKLFPKLDPNKKDSLEDHIKKFMLSLILMNLQHEDIVYRLFSYTFRKQRFNMVFSLAKYLITRWNYFETTFIENLVKIRPQQL
jgi:hypothetical protein